MERCDAYEKGSYDRDACERGWAGVTGKRKRRRKMEIQNQINTLNSLISTLQAGDATQNTAISNLQAGEATQNTTISNLQTSLLALQETVNNASDLDFVGDLKYALRTTDHDGWFKLDGASYTSHSMTQSQQNAATSLGFSGSLPNLTNAYLSQKGGLGGFSGSNTATLVRTNLPDVTLTGTTSTGGSHTHGLRFGQVNGDDYSLLDGGGGSFVGNEPAPVLAGGDHNHTFTTSSLNSSPQTPISTTPLTYSANLFVYLGL